MRTLAFSPERLASFASSSVTSWILRPLTPPASLTFLKYAFAPSRMSSPNSLLLPLRGPDCPIRTVVLDTPCASVPCGAAATRNVAATINAVPPQPRVVCVTPAVRANTGQMSGRSAADASKCLILIAPSSYRCFLPGNDQQYPCLMPYVVGI